MIVVDASAMLEVLLRTPGSGAVEDRLFGAASLHAPHLLDLEIAQVLRRHERTGALTPGRGLEALEDFSAFRIARYSHKFFLPRVWSLRRNATAYDACYLALAEMLGAPLVTRDRRLASAPGHHARVELLELN